MPKYKYTTEELLAMDDDYIYENICNYQCDKKICPFKKSLRDCREDGFCINRSYKAIDKWIKEDEEIISDLEIQLSKVKNRISKYNKWKKKFAKTIEGENKNE